MQVNSIQNSQNVYSDKKIQANVQKPVNSTSGSQETQPLHTSLINDKICKILPGGCVQPAKLFNDADSIISDALSTASAKYPGAQARALNEFHNDIDNMTPRELDEMKDTLVDRMASPKTSQWERNLLQKMYAITDAVAENRIPPHVGEKFPIRPIPGNPGRPFPKFPEPQICGPFPWQREELFQKLETAVSK